MQMSWVSGSFLGEPALCSFTLGPCAVVSDERMSQGHGGQVAFCAHCSRAVKLQDSSGAESKPALMKRMIIRRRGLMCTISLRSSFPREAHVVKRAVLLMRRYKDQWANHILRVPITLLPFCWVPVCIWIDTSLWYRLFFKWTHKIVH